MNVKLAIGVAGTVRRVWLAPPCRWWRTTRSRQSSTRTSRSSSPGPSRRWSGSIRTSGCTWT